MKQELRAIGIVQKKEITSKTIFEVLTVILKNDFNKIKQINFIQIDIIDAHLFKYKPETRNISKVNIHYKITFLIEDKYYHQLEPGMECIITINYNDQYISKFKIENIISDL